MEMPAEAKITTCPLDCPDACALEVQVTEGRVSRIGADTASAHTSGFICGKVSGFAKRLYHAERVLHPLRRVGPKGEGGFERISWDEAIDTVAGNLRAIAERWGGEAILPFHYGGSNGLLTDELLDFLFFSRLGASRLSKTICALPATQVALGMYGKMPGVAFSDYPHAETIVVWGANPRGSNIHLVPYLKEARKRGAWVALVDPRRTLGEGEIDLHLPVLPGQDLPLALAMIQRWRAAGQLDREFIADHADGLEPLLERAAEWSVERAVEVTGVTARAIVELADRLAEANPSLVRCGWGPERNRNGAQAMAAVLAIPALLGKFGVRGGGYTLSNSGAVGFDRDSLIGPLDWNTRNLNMSQLGRLLGAGGEDGAGSPLQPPIKALFVYNANPAATVPDQRSALCGLARADLFTVVHDQVMTDTALWADIVLPAVTFLEGHDLRAGYGNYMLGGVVPVVEPEGEAISNMALFSRLGRVLGFEDEAFQLSDEELLRRAAAAVTLPGTEVDVERIAAGGQQSYDFAGAPPVQLKTSPPLTADGRIHLTPSVLGAEPYRWLPPDEDWPLALVSPASQRLTNSTFGESNLPRLTITVHPEEADARGLATGDHVRVLNQRGEVHCRLEVNEAVRPGVASMPKGAWARSSLNGLTTTALCPDDGQVVGGAACFNDARVEIQPF
jgi:anaerobic selenocysteine-containing dehydrogenase